MKKILFVIRTLGPGGAEKSLVSFFNLLNEDLLKKEEWKIDLLMTCPEGFFCDQIPRYVNILQCPKGYAAYCNPISDAKRYNMLTISSLARKGMSVLVKRLLLPHSELSAGEIQWKYVGKTLPQLDGRYDVAVAYCQDASAYYVIDKVKSKKKIIWIHNEYDKLGLTDNYERYFYNKADDLVTISNRCVDSFLKHFPEMKQKIHMIENITAGNLILKMAKDYFPVEYMKYRNQVKFVSVGRLMHQKGYDLGIKAFAEAIKYNDNIHWFIVGAGELEGKLKAQVINEHIEDYITFLGLKKNPYPYIYNSDVFFQPSRYEGKSIALDEAMILGKPILATRYNTVSDSVIDSKNGLLCDFEPDDIAQKIIRMTENRELRSFFANNQKQYSCGNTSEFNKYIALFK